MEYEKIKQLMEDMGNSKLSSVDIEFPDGTKIKMEKNIPASVENTLTHTSIHMPVPAVQQVCVEKTVEEVTKREEIKDGNIVKSPMVGTFYSKSSPTSSPYVEVGSEVKKGTVLCIVEAMKLMNEIESEFNGKIAEILLKDGEAVEYGQPLFRVV